MTTTYFINVRKCWWVSTPWAFLGFPYLTIFFSRLFFPFRWDTQSSTACHRLDPQLCGSSSFTHDDVNQSMVVNTQWWCESSSKASWVGNLGYALTLKQASVKLTFYHITSIIHSWTSLGKNHLMEWRLTHPTTKLITFRCENKH